LYFINKKFIFNYRTDKVMIKLIDIAMFRSHFVYDFEIKLSL
jgi:hypothetical protein